MKLIIKLKLTSVFCIYNWTEIAKDAIKERNTMRKLRKEKENRKNKNAPREYTLKQKNIWKIACL